MCKKRLLEELDRKIDKLKKDRENFANGNYSSLAAATDDPGSSRVLRGAAGAGSSSGTLSTEIGNHAGPGLKPCLPP